MATVYVGRLSGAVGFWRLVAIKRAHAHLLEQPAFARMLVAEARLASKIHHPNVVSVQDVEELEGELLLVMDYVEGASLAALIAQAAESGVAMPARVAARIVLDAAAGLHAAHELLDEDGHPLRLVHRDVSPHNVLVGVDGVARLADFGIAKVSQGGSGAGTATGALKGKVAYMAPEYVDTGDIDARGDVFALGIVAWEALSQKRLFRGANDVETLRLVLAANVAPLSSIAPSLGTSLDAVVAKALARDPRDRFESALAFSEAFEALARGANLLASAAEVAAFVRSLVGPVLDARRALIRGTAPGADENAPATSVRPPESGREVRTLTLPIASVPPPAANAEEETTLGAGTAARTVEAARGEARGAPKRRAPYGAAILLGALAAGAVVIGLELRSRAPAVRSGGPRSASTSVPSEAESVAPPAIATSAVVAKPAARPSSAASVTAAPSTAARPRGAPPAPGRPAVTPRPADKAPPNPYGDQ
jgi:serine/threonine-protein kinase